MPNPKDGTFSLQWDDKYEKEEKDFDFTIPEIELLKRRIELMSKEEKITVHIVETCNKIMDEKTGLKIAK